MADLESLRQSIKKEYPGVIDFAADQKFFATGLKEMDAMLGGGLPRGRIIELYGLESSGKSTIAMAWARMFLEAGEHVTWVDFEGAWTERYGLKHGVASDDPDLVLVRPHTMEAGFDIFHKVMNAREGGLYVIDSLAAALADLDKVELQEKGRGSVARMDDVRPAAQSRAIASCLRKTALMWPKHQATLIIVNQTRMDLSGFQAKETTPGGKSLKFFASQRIRIRRKEVKVRKWPATGEEFKVLVVSMKMVKNKVSESEGQEVNLHVVPMPPTPKADLTVARARQSLEAAVESLDED